LSKLFSNTHKEYLTLNKVGEDILDRQEKLGLLNVERGGTRQRLGSGQPGRIDVANVVQDPEKRHRVLSFMETFIRNPNLMEDIVKINEKNEKTDESAVKKKKQLRVKKVKKDDRHHSRRTSSVKKNK